MVHADHGVEFTIGGPKEEGIGRIRPGEVDSLLAGLFHGRQDRGRFFISKKTAFSGVGIEPGGSQSRVRDTKETLQGIVRDPGGLHDFFDGQQAGNITIGHMDGDQDHPQGGTGQHHDHFYPAGHMGQQVRCGPERGGRPVGVVPC